jgi:hypothetical protein
MACCNPAGEHVPSFVVFKVIRMNADLRNDVLVGVFSGSVLLTA